MKPKRIILVRHGESEGNVDKTIYARKPDYALQLTLTGQSQAYWQGIKIRDTIVKKGSVAFYISPYWRTRRTYQEISMQFPNAKMYEDARLREQEWSAGWRHPAIDYETVEKERDSYGSFYYRLPGGENCADVYDRVSDFLNTLHRDFEKSDCPENIIIVTHGMTMRLFLMRWFHYSVEQFERIANPKNTEFWVMEKGNDDKYSLVTVLAEYKEPTHPYQFDWSSRNNYEQDNAQSRTSLCECQTGGNTLGHEPRQEKMVQA